MIDRECRDILKNVLQQFYIGCITNTQLIDILDKMEVGSVDPAIEALISEVDNLFDDTMGHSYCLSGPGASQIKPFVARLIRFLGTDIEYTEELAGRHRGTPGSSRVNPVLNVISLGIYGVLTELLLPKAKARTPEELWGAWPFPSGYNENSGIGIDHLC